MPQYNSNIKIAAPQPLDSRYFNGISPYHDVGEALSLLNIGQDRYQGLTINVNGEEYWFKDGVQDTDLILKQQGGGGVIPSGLVKDVVNLASYVGGDSVQRIKFMFAETEAVSFSGDYFSTYYNYYIAEYDVIEIGAPSDGIPRRAYIAELDNGNFASFIWSDSTSNLKSGWNLIRYNIEEHYGHQAYVDDYVDYYRYTINDPFQNEYFDELYPLVIGGLVLGSVSGILDADTVIKIDTPIVGKRKDDIIGIRSLRTKNSDVLSIDYDDYFIDLNVNLPTIKNTTVFGSVGLFKEEVNNEQIFRGLIPSGATTIKLSPDGSSVIIHTPFSDSGTTGSNITGGVNGIEIYGNSLGLGGSLDFNTTIDGEYELSLNTKHSTISGETLTIKSTNIDVESVINYASNYTNLFTDNSLVDKRYVDGLLGGDKIEILKNEQWSVEEVSLDIPTNSTGVKIVYSITDGILKRMGDIFFTTNLDNSIFINSIFDNIEDIDFVKYINGSDIGFRVENANINANENMKINLLVNYL